MSLPVVIRRDHNGESYEDPPYHMQDRMEKDRESAASPYPQGVIAFQPYETQTSMYFRHVRADAQAAGIKCVIINQGEPEPEDAEIILIQR
jgi:hypothetical protein